MKNTITGYTGLYGVVANPIKHSFSPMMHNTAFQTLGINDVYLAFEVTKDQLDDYIRLLRHYLLRDTIFLCLINRI